ncbi:helix-turn-helix domain-containing protein [Marispirochaeta aestuarii]|uniref:helix-turn-helix domain-containing protein n=1 Tax=Marispirochaeta aestuarii TaxID=1963862 RepID=UPI0029C86E54|nr:helix-turn-helix domain-containing protein [Marispirochaeta aestuarii]
MESIGEKLRSRRQEEGYSLDQVCRDTNIAKSYLEALEQEDFSAFPGEPYLIGFLRNYSDYLGLDVNEMISLYKNFKIQEQPVPMDELLVKRGPSPVLLILIGLTVLAAVGAGFLFFPRLNKPVSSAAGEAAAQEQVREVPASADESLFLFTDEIVEQRFETGTRIEIPDLGPEYSISLLEAGDQVSLSLAGEETSLNLGEERRLDLNGDGRDDLNLLVRDIDSAAGTTVLRLDKAVTGPEQPAVITEDIPVGTTQLASREVPPQVLYRAPSPEVITLTASFRGNCLFRYEYDGEPRQERFFQRDEVLRLNFSNSLKIWASNGGAVQGRIKGEEVSFGRSGQVTARLLKWRITDGEYELVLYPLY